MRALLPCFLLLWSTACGSALKADRDGAYDVGGGYRLFVSSQAGGGRCDHWGERDWADSLAPEDLPGFCVAETWVEGPDPAWVLWEGADGEPHDIYGDQALELRQAGSEAGDDTNLKFLGVRKPGGLTARLLWGDEDDPDTWEIAEIAVKGVRYKAP